MLNDEQLLQAYASGYTVSHLNGLLQVQAAILSALPIPTLTDTAEAPPPEPAA